MIRKFYVVSAVTSTGNNVVCQARHFGFRNCAPNFAEIMATENRYCNRMDIEYIAALFINNCLVKYFNPRIEMFH
jgi:hypothetical protein